MLVRIGVCMSSLLLNIETLYKKWIEKKQISDEWAGFFLEVLEPLSNELSKSHVNNKIDDSCKIINQESIRKTEEHIIKLVESDLDKFQKERWRRIGYKAANLDPLGFADRIHLEDIDNFRDIYGGTIGYDIHHLSSDEEKDWFYKKIESVDNAEINYKQMSHGLIENGLFENFLNNKFQGAKRFSGEGCDAIIPLIQHIIRLAQNDDIAEVVIGMAHRARLSMMCHAVGFPLKSMMALFKGKETSHGSGDVKYHSGYQNKIGPIEVTLIPNPSHLEAVNPVVLGYVNGRRKYSPSTFPVLIHGDASFAGQGIVQEILQMYAIHGYEVHGTIHVIVDNQIGFTADPEQSRSTWSCSDLAKGFDLPVIHVNAEDPEAAIRCANLAYSYKQKFHKDIIIRLVGYRRYGHNETDDPSVTQPVVYKKVASMIPIHERYPDNEFASKYKEQIAAAYEEAEYSDIPLFSLSSWNQKNDLKSSAISEDRILKLENLWKLKINVQDRVSKIYEQRLKMAKDGKMDWGMAELYAYESLLEDGYTVRLSGQDSQRGTFSHRHAMVWDTQTNQMHSVLPKLECHNSLLSEYGVLGFEFGNSISDPDRCVIWEAQFGDFANGAQIVIDQYISSSYQKWALQSGLILMLPHGYEGQGPEHSSARIERMLQLCAENNMEVVQCTSPSNLFHKIRMQMCKEIRTPLILITPKSLLRHKDVISDTNDMSKSFEEIRIFGDKSSKKLIFCSGRILYDICSSIKDSCIISIEQLYPFPIDKILKHIKEASSVIWAQDEPKNMGAWTYVSQLFLEDGIKIKYIGRKECSVTACGSLYRHKRESEEIIKEILSTN
jgi:2-oxoglutarate dehydrogenase E1 component